MLLLFTHKSRTGASTEAMRRCSRGKDTKNFGKSFSFGRKNDNKWIIIWKIRIFELSLYQIRNERMTNDNTQQIPPSHGDHYEASELDAFSILDNNLIANLLNKS